MPDRGRLANLADSLGSFRTRLRLFFLLIVIVPMVSVTLIVFRLIAESEHGQADARVAARQDAAITLYYEARDVGDRLARRIGRDPRLAAALRADDRPRIVREARRLRDDTTAERVVLSRGSSVLADVGSKDAAFPATRDLVAGGRRVAQLQVSAESALDFARLVHRGDPQLEAVVRVGGHVLAATLPGSARVRLPDRAGTVKIGGKTYRAATFQAPGFLGTTTRVTVLQVATTSSDIRRGRIIAGIILAGFFLLALLSAIVVSRSLQRQIGSFLGAARRLGGGDFSAEVPTRGGDEFAELGDEFNKMSRQLEQRLEELSRERLRLELSLRRLGETFAANLDRDALLEIVVRTAVDAVNAQGGYAALPGPEGGRPAPVARAGDDAERPDAVAQAEQQVLAGGGPVVVDTEEGHALAHPLRILPASGRDGGRAVAGVVAVWRGEEPFNHRERELFNYLAAQAAVSVENVGLHETVERQAVTDELTGLSNRRRFQETITTEVERSRRFGQELALVMLDIDDFKAVNDNYGHQQGDLVLREVSRILRESSREIDEPARYGGEELAVVLPGTDRVGAFNLAERVREGIEALELSILGDQGRTMRVTASFGVAAMAHGQDARGLVAAADEALYEAKRTGKNRTVQAV